MAELVGVETTDTEVEPVKILQYAFLMAVGALLVLAFWTSAGGSL